MTILTKYFTKIFNIFISDKFHLFKFVMYLERLFNTTPGELIKRHVHD